MSNEDEHAVIVAKAIVEKHCRSIMGVDACVVDNPKNLFSDIVEAVNTHTTNQQRIAELEAALRGLRVRIEEWAESEDSDGHTEIVNWPEMYEARQALANEPEGEGVR